MTPLAASASRPRTAGWAFQIILEQLDGQLKRAVASAPKVFARRLDRKVWAYPSAFESDAARRVVVHLAYVEDAAVGERVPPLDAEDAAARRLAYNARAPCLAQRGGEDLSRARRARVRQQNHAPVEARERIGGRK